MLKWATSTASNGAACVQYATSSHCYNGANCVQYGKSSFSGSNGGGCVEVGTAVLAEASEEGVRPQVLNHEKIQEAAAAGEPLRFLRDSKDPEGPVLAFTPGEWDAFLAGVRNGEFS